MTAALAMGCSSGGGSTGGSSSSSGGADTTGSGGTGGTSASGGGSTTGGGGAGGAGGGDSGASNSLPAGDCFTFATQKAEPYTSACGDFMAMTGANVDLNAGAGSSQLCLLSGNYPSLAAVPSSYASCTWTTYIEGSAGLANHGVIVLDSTGQHHYRMWIASNTLPNLLFSFADID